MGKRHGIRTVAIGKELQCNLDANAERYHGIGVFYDHGDSSDPEVCRPTTYMGRRYGSDATLSGVDIVVTEAGRVIAAIEVEESTVRPKAILGDVFGIALAGRMRIHGRPYPIVDATIVIAIADDSAGKQAAKYARLERHLQHYFQANPSDAVGKIRIVSCRTNDLVTRIERLIRLETGKRSRRQAAGRTSGRT